MTAAPRYTEIPNSSILSPSPTPSSPLITTPITTANQNRVFYGFTYQYADGNRVVPGMGNLPNLKPLDIQLPGTPIWIAAAPLKDGAVWTVVLSDSRAFSFYMLENGDIEDDPAQVDIPAGMPPAIISRADNSSLILVPDLDQSQLSHPIYLPLSDQRAYISTAGEIRFMDASDQLLASLDVHALPDARILRDENDRLLVLSDPTDKYDHGVLGDNLEAASITLIETLPEPLINSRITLNDNEVIEGIAPIWADLTGDGRREIIVTVSNLDLGAGIAVFNESGDRIAEGPKFGRPYRWRHQIAVDNLGPHGETELVVVRTPHIGGTVEYYQLHDGELAIAAEFAGITSHTNGSRNLDQAAVGDFDGDGFIELLVLNPALSEYIAVQRTSNGAEELWRLHLDGILNTNLAGVLLPSGRSAICIGRADGVLRLWLPED